MAYDETLAQRIRVLMDGQDGLSEKKMFGGLSFLIHGNMAVAASGQDGILVRVDPARTDELMADSRAEVMVMRGRPMSGWLRVAGADVQSDAELAKWVELGAEYAASLPAKAGW